MQKEIDPLDNLNTKTKYRYLGRPTKIALPSKLWRQGELVQAIASPKEFSQRYSLPRCLQHGVQSRH
jgi:hypothetical protein